MKESIEEMLQRVSEEVAFDEFYRKNVRLEINWMGEGDVKAEPTEVQLKYQLNLDHKSWGLAGIELNPVGSVTFEVVVDDYSKGDTEEKAIREVTLNFDELKELHMVWESGKTCSPETLEVTLDQAFKIVDVSLYATFLDPS
jgi:hypothetical protein